MKRKQSVRCLAAFLSILPVLLLFSGCYTIEEVDSKAYPIAIAIDKEGDKIELGVQFGKVLKSAEGGTPTEEGNIVIKYEGLSIYDAFEKLNNRTSKRLSYAQIKAIIISEEFARDGIMPMVLSLVNSYNLAPNIYVMVAAGSAVDYLDNQKIWLETTPSKFYELFYQKAYRSFLNVMTISEIAFSHISGQEEIVLPYITYVKETEDEGVSTGEGEHNVKTDEKTKEEFNSNQVLSITPGKSEITRLAVFKQGKMLDYLEGDQVEAYGLMKGNYYSANITVPVEEDFSKLMNVFIQNKVKPIKKVEIIGGVPHISIDINVEVTKISSVSAPEYQRDISAAEELIEQYAEKICMDLLTNTKYVYNSDILGFGKYAMSNFQTYEDLQNFNWKDNYRNAEFDVNVKAETFTNYLVLDPNYETQ